MSFLTRLTKIFGVPVSSRPKRKQPAKIKAIKLEEQKAIALKATIEAKAKASRIVLEAKNSAFRIKTKTEQEARKIQQETFNLKEKINRRQAELEKKVGILEERQRLLSSKEKDLSSKLKKIEKIKKQQLAKLERAAGLTRQEAKKLILEAVEKKSVIDIALRIKEAEEKADREAEEKAREILIEAMRLGATDYVPEYTVSTIKLKDEDMKGRIIGKEGRNIRTFEKCTGVDVNLDEEGTIRLSSFDAVRREIAKVALEKLLADGRIQPVRIEEVVKRTREEIDRLMNKAGKDLCHRLKVYNLPPDVVNMLGRFKYRFSYGQSLIAHTIEETKIGVKIAHEIGADINVVRLGCLLHDIGKVITEEEGSHVQTGVNFLKKYSIPQPILNCVAQHHEDEPFSSTESVIVYIADAISGSRPGARYEDYEGYAARLEKLEEFSLGFKGVKSAYAIQAGREVRVIVNPDKLNDSQIIKLASDLKEKIQKELSCPGNVRITVIRETRAVEVAK